METAVMHPTYLPFREEQLLARFAAASGGGDPAARLEHYRGPLEQLAAAEAVARVPHQRSAGSAAGDTSLDRDERFWTASALLSLVEGPSPAADLAALLRLTYGEAPPFAGFATWADALGPAPELYLEVSLPSPPSYQHHLRSQLRRHVLTYQQYRQGTETTKLEGASLVDAVVVSPTTGMAVVVVAEVLADIASSVTYDVVRNELARLVDVTLDAHKGHPQPALRTRRPDRTCVLLLTPEVFRDDRTSRLYGHLHTAYTTHPDSLEKHLPHRPGPVVRSAAGRLGWATWEDVERVRPGSLPWRR
ncbi:hypothetical protein [Pseudokineococcus sp. 1T1Z-3]|uniref:hypothetical protein n=1 Tax=Pseudokineococcus sp. 1T1Z-3 TaxID=3132745 RepID=UPI00309C24F2